MPAKLQGSAAAEWRANWKIVLAAGAGVGISTLPTYSSSLFIAPMEAEFGWTRAQIMSGHVITATAAVLFAPFIGALVDRYGPRRIGILAAFAICAVMALLGTTSDNVWHWRGLWAVVALAVLLVQPTVWTAAVTSVFAAGRGLALAVTLCGSGIGSLITPPLTYALIENFGWRAAFGMLALCWGIVVVPLIVLFFTSASDRARTGGDATVGPPRAVAFGQVFRSVMLTRRFIQVALAGLCIATVVVSIVVSLVPIMSAGGIERGTTAAIAGMLGFASIFGRLTIGYLLDRVQARFLAASALLLPIVAIGLLVAMPQSIPAAIAAVLIIGLTLGAELDILAYVTSRYFAISCFGVLFGTIGGFVTLAGGVGPVILNAVYDATGSYIPALLAAIPLCLLASLLFLLIGPYPQDAADG